MNRPKPPPVDLDKYCEGRSRNFVSYQDGARMYGMSYWGFVRLCQEIEANIPLRKTSIVDTEIVDAYIESLADENTEKKEKVDMARKKYEDLEDLIKLGKKKYVRIAEGAELYSVGLHTFESWGKDAGAIRKVKGVVLVNTEKIDRFIESFAED
ncbi:DUF6462 family protein [Butyrivibrio sp. XPD2006]|uniref:DUF6462 family protein n=1 Tax=Butyrivibrio sp. XPD2006 TaxID=1280668 RepID=UPI001FA74477|nr:DUF6462 family protein [Butyrivibrio sp. XPD2006]